MGDFLGSVNAACGPPAYMAGIPRLSQTGAGGLAWESWWTLSLQELVLKVIYACAGGTAYMAGIPRVRA